jgi:hypothetical protein
MPRIIVMSEPSAEGEGVITLAVMMSEPNTPPEGAITLDERVTAADLRSGHHSAQLIERVGWAVHDADDVERADAESDDPQSARSRTSARRAKALTN